MRKFLINWSLKLNNIPEHFMKNQVKPKKLIVSGHVSDGKRASTFGSCKNTRILNK